MMADTEIVKFVCTKTATGKDKNGKEYHRIFNGNVMYCCWQTSQSRLIREGMEVELEATTGDFHRVKKVIAMGPMRNQPTPKPSTQQEQKGTMTPAEAQEHNKKIFGDKSGTPAPKTAGSYSSDRDEKIMRQVALKCAVDFALNCGTCGPDTPLRTVKTVTLTAGKFLAFLRDPDAAPDDDAQTADDVDGPATPTPTQAQEEEAFMKAQLEKEKAAFRGGK